MTDSYTTIKKRWEHSLMLTIINTMHLEGCTIAYNIYFIWHCPLEPTWDIPQRQNNYKLPQRVTIIIDLLSLHPPAFNAYNILQGLCKLMSITVIVFCQPMILHYIIAFHTAPFLCSFLSYFLKKLALSVKVCKRQLWSGIFRIAVCICNHLSKSSVP